MTPATQPVITKTALKMKSLLDQFEEGSRVNPHKKSNLQIICADDWYYNLEALRVVFQNIGLVEHCTFVNNGQEAIDSVVKSIEDR